jgi:CubicO group peptidase (beta-lactamase class C family)
MRRRRGFRTGIAMALLAGCTAASPAPPPAAPPPTILETDRYQPQQALAGCPAGALPSANGPLPPALQAAIARAQAYSDSVGGVGFMVVHDGQVVAETYANGAGPAARTEAASMMKTVLALVTGIAVDKGIIGGVDDPVGRHVAEWRDDPRGAITLRQLLTMSSGLAGIGLMTLLTAPDNAAAALQLPLEAEPGTVFRYSNAVSNILGTAVDRAARARGYAGFADLMQRELWCPLGNGDAALWIDREGGNPRYYAGLHATLRDWARIGELIRNRGRSGDRQIVSEGWIEAMTAPSSVNPQYGYQLWLGGSWTPRRRYAEDNPVTVPHGEPYLADDVIFLDGFGGQRVYVIPSRGLTIARTGLVDLAYDDAVIVNAILRGLD